MTEDILFVSLGVVAFLLAAWWFCRGEGYTVIPAEYARGFPGYSPAPHDFSSDVPEILGEKIVFEDKVPESRRRRFRLEADDNPRAYTPDEQAMLRAAPPAKNTLGVDEFADELTFTGDNGFEDYAAGEIAKDSHLRDGGAIPRAHSRVGVVSSEYMASGQDHEGGASEMSVSRRAISGIHAPRRLKFDYSDSLWGGKSEPGMAAQANTNLLTPDLSRLPAAAKKCKYLAGGRIMVEDCASHTSINPRTDAR